MADLTERIVLDPLVLVGKPVIRGTRISVEFMLGLMAERWGAADILKAYPGLVVEDIQAYLAYARHIMSSERVFPTAA
jgi:uncharacterized protein (DUF433 family)